MSRHSIGIAALLAGWVVLCAARQAVGTTFTYNGNPDHPFPGAWGDPDVDCSDPHDPGESECWECQGSSPAVAVPKFEWILTRECPTFSMSNTVQSNCYCVLAGSRMTESVSAGYEAEDGRKYFEPSVDGCGGDPPEEEAITQDIEWDWSTSGLSTVPASGTGQTADFEYTVPRGEFSIDVSFSAKATPSDTNCAEITAGPEVVGKISGEGYQRYAISPVRRVYPPPNLVQGLVTGSNNDRGFGRINYKILGPKFMCEDVCSDVECKMVRLEGSAGIVVGDMDVASCIKVTVDGCSLPKGSCNPRNSYDIARTIAHEKKHLDIWWDFIDQWNNEIMNMGLFDSCEFAEDEGRKLIIRFNRAYAKVKQQQKDHCPNFAGEQKYTINGCGSEFPYGGVRTCP